MSTSNPLEQLRRRMQSHATPAAFAALAEEHRRAGRFAEAIAVCRDGLARYPAYVSARVTLGRALLDSGDVSSALTELEQAVAQAPDNLAAARALESAHTALGTTGAFGARALPSTALPASSSPSRPSPTDSPLHADQDLAPVPPSVVAEALTAAADGPQGLGLGPDWSIPAAHGVAPEGEPAVAVHDDVAAEDGDPLAFFAQCESETIDVTSRHARGDEPADIWCVPVPTGEADESIAGALGASWAPDPPADASGLGASPPAAETATMAETVDLAADQETSPFWTGVFGGEPETETPPPFAGWGDDVPEAAAGADRLPWSEPGGAEPTDAWAVPDGPSPTWALAEPPQATIAPSPDAAWAGSVKSAIGEVFARAGRGESEEPPPDASAAVRTAMADAAVEAAIEDVALRDDAPTPALVSLQQMLDSVRARRAALFHDVQS